MKAKLSSSPKKGSLGFLALFGFLILAILTFYFWPTDEITAVSSEINTVVEQKLAEIPAVVEPLKPATVAVSLSEPKPKIDPQLVEELKQLKKEKKHKRVQVLVEIENDDALDAIKKAGGTVTQKFDTGNIAVVNVQSDRVQEIVDAAGVEQVASEREYNALLADRIPAFSIDTAWESNFTGKDVKIAILDTGVGPNDKVIVTDGVSFVTGEDTADLNGHGTHVAGIAQGVAKDSLIYNAKVLNKAGAGTTSQIIAGIDWAVSNDVDIISMSFGGTFTDLDGPLASAVKDAIDNGIVFVVAAGNCKKGCGGFFGVTTPGNVKEVITVGAVDDSNVVATFSSGDTFDGYLKPDITGPGVDITSAWLDNSEATKSGTSMSTPFVAGIAALLLEKEPGLTNEQVKERLEATSADKGDAGKDVSYGSGIVNVEGLLLSKEVVEDPVPEVNETEGNVTEEKNAAKPKPTFENLTIFTNMTVIFEKEGAGKYTYHTDDGRNLTFEYRIYSPDNDTLDSQMLIAPEVGPGDYVPATLEFAVDDKPSETPLYYYFEVRDVDGAHAITPAAYSLPSYFIADLYSGDPGDIALIYHSFDAPTEIGTYTAYAYVLSSDFDIVMEDIDTLGHEFDVVEDPIDFGLCDSDSDCPDDYYIGSKFCKGGDVYREYRDWECKYPGSSGSYCIFDDYDEEVDSCSSKETCYEGKCNKCDDDGDCESGEKYEWCPEDCDPVCTNDDGDAYGMGWPCLLYPDCDDSNPFIYPGAPETCNGKDDNCNGLKDEGFSGIPEDCDNSIDDNCNGFVNEGCCGNGACNAVENPTTCSTDCYAELNINKIVSAPSIVEQGQETEIIVEVENTGTYKLDELHMEAGIAPDYWEGTIFTYDAQLATDMTECCPGNPFYTARNITDLDPGEKQTVTFKPKAPYAGSTDACYSDPFFRSAWDISHEIVIGTYDSCGGYIQELTQSITVKEKSCTKNSDCIGNAKCEFTGINGKCIPLPCAESCTPDAYSCKRNAQYQCIDDNDDGCYEKKYVKNCGVSATCEDGKPACTPKPPTGIVLEESGSGNIWAQAGDFVTVNLVYSKTESVELKYDSVFTLDTSTCPSGVFTLSKNRACKFTISDTAKLGDHNIWLKGGSPVTVTVMAHPAFMIITDKPKLYQRFGSTESVYNLLTQTYAYAENKQGIIYDLEDYSIGTHPWSAFSKYKETFSDHKMEDNTYALDVANFITEKCNDKTCDDVLILGDDFVIPHYRRTLNMSAWFGFKDYTDDIYTDVSYIKRTSKTFSEFEDIFYQDEKFDGKQVLVILPDTVSPELRTQIDRMEAFLTDETGPIKADIEERDASDAPCNSHLAFTYYDGWTLIIVGNETTNQAMNCFPFVIDSEFESVTIERNPWDGSAYAVVVNSGNEDVLGSLNDALEKGTYADLHSEGWLVARTGANVAAGAAVGLVVIGSGGTATPAILMVATGAAWATDAVDGAECLEFSGGECIEFVAGLFLPPVLDKIGKPAVKFAVNEIGPQLRYFYEELGDGISPFLKKMGKRGMLNTGTGFDKIVQLLKQIDHMKGTSKAESSIGGKLAKFIARADDDFRNFIIKFSETNPEKARSLLKTALTTGLDKGELASTAKLGHMPAKWFLNLNELDESVPLVVDDEIYDALGRPIPLWKGKNLKSLEDPEETVKLIEDGLDLSGKSDYNFAEQIAAGGSLFHHNALSTSLTRDFKVGGWYAKFGSISYPSEGIVQLWDRRYVTIVNPQKTLEPIADIMPEKELADVDMKTILEFAQVNNEMSMLGQPDTKYLVGWQKVRWKNKETFEIVDEFIENPSYVGKQSDWAHVKTIDDIKKVQTETGVENPKFPGNAKWPS